MKKIITAIAVAAVILLAQTSAAQILLSAGTSYAQNFDSLASASGTVNWTNNLTLPGWYAAKGATDAVTYVAGTGSGSAGSIYSFGVAGANPVSDRALGSVAASSLNYAYGVRFTNDLALVATNFSIAYTGEQWRNANTVTNTLAFSYQVASPPLTNADALNSQTWIAVAALNFNSPNTNGGTTLDGNLATNRQSFTNLVLTGVAVLPGQEIFLRWRDVDDGGSDAGIAVDNLTVSFSTTAPPANSPPMITTPPQSQSVSAGATVAFSVVAGGTAPFSYQWSSNSVAIPGATNDTFTLNNVPTNLSGSVYFVTVTNFLGATNSASATLTVNAVVMPAVVASNGVFTLLTYNVNGNGTTNWSTNATQVAAVGRELIYFNADIVTFNEIPLTNTYQMANWVTAFMPGFFLATNSGTDGSIRAAIASRYPITRSQSWLNNSSLLPYGYTGSGFTRDLFEAQIAMPNWPLPLHVFVAHLKATGFSNPQDDADKRAAMASAVSNFFVNVYLPGTNGTHPYILAGDLNESAFLPDNNYVSGHPIQRIVSGPTGLQLTDPVNSITHTDLTESIRGPLDTRFDYILPCGQLFTNIVSSQVFRTDLLTNFPPNLFSNDDKIASDHLPVLMTFANPFDTPYKFISLTRTNQSVTLKWEAQNNRTYSVEASTNLTAWTPFATNLVTATTNSPYVFTTNNVSDKVKFFRLYRVP